VAGENHEVSQVDALAEGWCGVSGLKEGADEGGKFVLGEGVLVSGVDVVKSHHVLMF